MQQHILRGSKLIQWKLLRDLPFKRHCLGWCHTMTPAETWHFCLNQELHSYKVGPQKMFFFNEDGEMIPSYPFKRSFI